MKRERDFFSFFLVLATIGGMLGFAATKDKGWVEILRPYAMAIAMLLVLGSVLGAKGREVAFTRKQKVIGSLGYAFSVMAISLVPEAYLYHWWMAGAVLVALYLHPYLGFAIGEILACLFCCLYGYGVESLIFYSVLGLVLCGLTQYMTSLASFAYVLVIALSSNLTLLLIMNNFAWKQMAGRAALYSLASTGAIVAAAYLLPRKGKEGSKGANEARLDKILAEDFVLRQRLRAYSEGLYRHSLQIGDMARRAALYVGCKEKVAQAGGLYHEIGRIQGGKGENSIDEGLRLGREHGFPKAVLAIICQHNAKYEKPQSMEAAIVMFADSIASAMAQMEKGAKEGKAAMPAQTLVEQMFEFRLSKGALDKSGMDIQSYRRLKEFFKNEYKNC